MTASANKKQMIYYIHTIICLLLMFGFGFLAPVAPLTATGMKIIGIFLGLLYGWSFLGQIWPSLLGLLALILWGYLPMKDVISTSFGNDTVVMMLFIFVFSALIDTSGLSRFIAIWFITRKFVMGKPWRFTFMFLFAIYILAALTSSSPAIVLGWGLLYSICQMLGYPKGHRYPMFMIFGVVFASQLGMSTLPFKAVPMIILNVYEKIANQTVDYLSYMAFAFISGVLGLLLLILIGKFLLKPDVSILKNCTRALIVTDEKELMLNREQKIIFFFLILLILLLTLPSVLPQDLFLAQFLNLLGATGVVMLLVTILIILQLQNKPLLEFRKMAINGISWDVILLIAAVMPISSALTSPETGFTDFLIQILNPLLGGASPFVFLLLVLLMAIIFTNFCNNAATAIALLPIAYTYSLTLGLNPAIVAVLITIGVHLAYLTPAASPSAALMHGNDWIDGKTIWRLGLPIIVGCYILLIAAALTIGAILF